MLNAAAKGPSVPATAGDMNEAYHHRLRQTYTIRQAMVPTGNAHGFRRAHPVILRPVSLRLSPSTKFSAVGVVSSMATGLLLIATGNADDPKDSDRKIRKE